MITFIFFCLGTIGLTNILVHGKIMDVIGLRPLLQKWMSPTYYQVFECYECTGFWAGLIMGLAIYQSWFFIVCGFVGAVVAQTFTDSIYLLRSKTDYEVDDGGE